VSLVCGRYVQVSSPTLLAERFAVDEVTTEAHEPDYNVTPRASVYGITGREHGRVLESFRWGLVPSWAKDPSIGDKQINARAETLADKPAYRRAFERRRCILPADGFYEWRARSGRQPKEPVFVRARDGEPLAFAGLWEVWRDRAVPDAEWLRTCVIVTTRANDVLAPIHDRMPVVLPEAAWATWLDPDMSDPTVLQPLLVPAPSELFEVYAVSTLVNKPEHNGPELVVPAEPDTLFR